MFKYYKQTIIRFCMLGGLVVCLWTIVITGSRGGMLGLVVTGLILAFYSRYRIIAYISAAVLIAGIYVVMPDQYKDRLNTVTEMDDQSSASLSAQGRIEGLVKGVEFMMEYPVTGVGIGNFRWKNNNEYGRWLDAHNLIGKLAGELGLLGIFAFIYFIVAMVKYLKYIKRAYIRKKYAPDFNYYLIYALRISLFMLFFQGLFGHNLFRYNWYIFAAFIVIIYDITKIRLEQETADKTETMELTTEGYTQ